MSDQRGSRFDRAIDGAVREMLDVEPRADLRARVMRRIANGDQQVATGFSRKKLLWLGAPVAAAALIVLAIVMPQRIEQPQTTVATNPSPGAPSPPAAPVVTGPPPGSRTPSAPRVAAATRPRVTAVPDRAVTAALLSPAETTTQIEPLKSITPIEMAPIAEHRVAPAAISVQPLNTIAELQITPLNPSERRN